MGGWRKPLSSDHLHIDENRVMDVMQYINTLYKLYIFSFLTSTNIPHVPNAKYHYFLPILIFNNAGFYFNTCYRATLSENFIVMINMFWQLNLTMFGGVTGHWPLSPNIFWNIPSLESTCPTSMIRNIECRVTILPIISSVNFLDFR